ncbi:hypothetical protein WJX74_006173 [Apatococcus lobatus]|uniref:Uncharacterized protein n=1 Tax=Apatococcus lobatus TaxID=904363 RepID=A0AAW1SCE6_9CHLO
MLSTEVQRVQIPGSTPLVPVPASTSYQHFWVVGATAALLTAQNFSISEAHAEKAETPEQQTDTAAHPSGNEATAKWRVYTNLARDMTREKKHDDAERYYKQALAEAKKGFGEEDPHVGAACNNMAEHYRLTKQWQLARPMYDEALRLLEQAYGRSDPRFAQALRNMASFCGQQEGQRDAAITYMTQAVQVMGSAMGKEHTEYAAMLLNLAVLLRRQPDRSLDATALLQESVQIYEAQPGGFPSEGVHALLQLAVAHWEAGKAADAAPLLMRGLSIIQDHQRRTRGGHAVEASSKPITRSHEMMAARAAWDIGVDLCQGSRWDTGRELLQQSLSIQSERLGGTHLNLAILLRKLAQVDLLKAPDNAALLRAQNEAQRACDMTQALCDAVKQAQDQEHGGSSGPGSWSWFRSKPKPADPHADHMREQTMRLAPVFAVECGSAWSVLAVAQDGLERRDEAEASLQKAITILRSPAAADLATASGSEDDLEAAARALQAPGLKHSQKLSLASYHRQLLASCLTGKAKLLLRKAVESQHSVQLKQDALALQEEAAALLGSRPAVH